MSNLSNPSNPSNPLLRLQYEPAFERLGEDFSDVVAAANFPQHSLRWRSDDVLQQLGIDPAAVSDVQFVEAFGQFQGRQPLLAMRYHGYQFGEYNPNLGDGRGFLYGQVRGTDGELYDLGTKGSGTTPYSRGGDGRLTLKGGIREVLAAEMLQRLGVRTSRCLSLVETGERLYRGDEPSPTRSAVMIRVQRSHVRFGTFERLNYFERRDLIAILLDHVIETYYPHLLGEAERYGLFYAELAGRVAELCAQWMAAGFCHAVLNTDNMSITGESFDYGPFAFIPSLDPRFTAAYFDYGGRYAYANQPGICRWNLEKLQAPLQRVIAQSELDAGLASYDALYGAAYRKLMLGKLGFVDGPEGLSEDPIGSQLLRATLDLLNRSETSYHEFFAALALQFDPIWRQDATAILKSAEMAGDDLVTLFTQWRELYHKVLTSFPEADLPLIHQQLRRANPAVVIVRPEIERVWDAIAQNDDWQPFNDLLTQIRA
jgi:serine/tyrosine/threonine adenylyltransferase